MTRRLLMAILPIIAFSFINSSAQYEYRNISILMRPEKSLSQEQLGMIKWNYQNYFKGRPIPAEVYKKFEKQPPRDRILNENGFELVNVSNAAAGQHETWIALNPTDPDNIIATSNDSRYLIPSGGYKMPAFYTKDGGDTWTESTTPSNFDLYIDTPDNEWDMTIFDPGITFDANGWAYYCYGFTQTVQTGRDQNGIFVCRSKDGGESWEDPKPVVLEKGSGWKPFHDRYTIVADNIESSPNKNNIYVTWRKFIINDGIAFSRSTDAGQTWSDEIILPESGGESGSHSPVPVVAPNGDIYVIYRAGASTKTEAVFQKSTDGGLTWLSKPITAQSVYPAGTIYEGRYIFEDKQNMRVSALPEIAVDCSNGPRKGWIYVVQAGRIYGGGSYGVFLTISKDGGTTWEKKMRIDDAEVRNDMFFPAIAVDPVTGIVAVFYYSSRNDENNQGIDAYMAVSTDGENFNNIRLTPETWYITSQNDVSPQGESNNFYWGDYTSMTAYNGKFYPLFWMPEPTYGNFDDLELFTVKLSLGPLRPENFTAKGEYENPEQINLSWINPTHTIMGSDIGNYTILLSRDGSQIAELESGKTSYTDSGLESGKEYNYQIIIKNQYGESIPISASAYAGGNPVPMMPGNISYIPSANGLNLSWINPSMHVDSSFAGDLVKIQIFVDDELHTDIEYEVSPGADLAKELNLDTERFYKITMKAVTSRAGVEYESQMTEEYIVYAGEPYATFEENFDNSSNIMPSYTDGSWDVVNTAAHSNPSSLHDSPDGDYEEGDFYSMFAPFVISDDKFVLNFYNIANIDGSGTDYATINVSNDFGLTWTEVFRTDETTHPDSFTGKIETSKWVLDKVILEDYIGDTLMVKFNVAANKFRNEDGWYIDDIVMNDEVTGVEDFVIDGSDIKVTPNPVSENAAISWKQFVPSNVEISIFDNLGNKVYTTNGQYYTPGMNSIDINLSTLSSGVYHVLLSSGNNKQMTRLVINK